MTEHSKSTPAPAAQTRLPKVFLCHASEDKPTVRELYRRLRADGVQPWLDEEDIPPGAPWEDSIEDAVKAADMVLVCISQHSLTKEGYLQAEIRSVLKVSDQKPDGTIYIVPVRLEQCEVPRKLSHLQWVNYFEENGYERVIRSLSERARKIGAAIPRPHAQPGKQSGTRPVQGPYERASEAAEFILQKSRLRPQIGLVLGSGLGHFGDRLKEAVAIDYDEIPHFPLPPGRVEFGRLVVGKCGDAPVAAMSGRLHAYEGLRWDEVIFPVRVFYRLGVGALVLTAAAGSLNPEIPAGTLVVLSDHINQLGSNPLSGPNDERFGPRFPDMTEVYSKRLRFLASEAARKLEFRLPEAVYLVHTGPTYETPAEIRLMRSQGADLVGMSTVPEAMAARQMGIPVLAICAVTNVVAGSTAPLGHEEVFDTAARLRTRFEALLQAVVPAIAAEQRR